MNRFFLALFFFAMPLAKSAANDLLPISLNNAAIDFDGTYDREAIRRLLQAESKTFNKCRSDKSIEFRIQITINEKGKGSVLSHEGLPTYKMDIPSDKALDCLSSIISKIKFPPKKPDPKHWATEFVAVGFRVGDPKPQAVETCNPSNFSKNFNIVCMALNNTVQLRQLRASHRSYDFDVVCKCIADNFPIKEMMPADSCNFSVANAFSILSKDNVRAVCIK